jgi:hypothetical protein
VFAPELPRNAGGKVMRDKVAERVRVEREPKKP